MKLPNLICVGFPKCGTTALTYNLNQHPDIYLFHQEPNILLSVNPNFNLYQSLFANKQQKYIGEKSLYITNTQAILNIKKHLSNCKIIVLLRDPIIRAFSHYYHYVRGFEEFGYMDYKELPTLREIWFRPHKHQSLYENIFETSYYYKYIEQLLYHIKSQNILFLLQEDFRIMPNKIYNKIFTWLNLTSIDIISHQINPQIPLKYSIDNELYKLLVTHYISDMNKTSEIVSFKIPLIV